MAFNRPETTTKIYKDWQTAVRKKYKFRCIICNYKSAIVHHLNAFHWAYSQRYDVNNGVVVCKIHHNEFHKLYTRKNNTRLQFEQYLASYGKKL